MNLRKLFTFTCMKKNKSLIKNQINMVETIKTFAKIDDDYLHEKGIEPHSIEQTEILRAEKNEFDDDCYLCQLSGLKIRVELIPIQFVSVQE